MNPNTQTSRHWLWLVIACMFIFWLLWLPNLLALPAHLDEGGYVQWAQWVWGEYPLQSIEGGKALMVFLTALANPFNQGLYIGRFMTLLVSFIGMASAYATARKLHSQQAGLLCALLWLATPGLMFFGRMYLQEVPLASMSVLTLWLTLRMSESRAWQRATWAGIGMFLCVAIKASGLVFLAFPILVLLFPPKPPAYSFIRRLRLTLIAYTVFGVLMAIPVTYLVSVRADPLYLGSDMPASVSTVVTPTLLINRTIVNMVFMIQAEYFYLTPLLLVLLLIAAIVLTRRNARVALLLLSIIGLTYLSVGVLAARLWLRYIAITTPYLLLMTACGLAYLLSLKKPVFIRPLTWFGAVVFVLVVGIPYALTAHTSPAALPMPGTDRFEYVGWVVSGYGIREAVEYIQQNVSNAQTVFTTAANCVGASAMFSGSGLDAPCSKALNWWDDPNIEYVASINEYAAQHGYVWIIADELDPIIAPERLPQPLRLVKTFPRPESPYNILLYCAGIDAENHCPSS